MKYSLDCAAGVANLKDHRLTVWYPFQDVVFTPTSWDFLVESPGPCW